MALGARIRALLGDRRSRQVGALYRAIFADMAAEAAILAAEVPRGAHVLDIGGGDGVPLNNLLNLRDDITAVSIDPAPVVGQWIEPRHDARITRLPGTTLEAFLQSDARRPDAVLLCDVMHHIPPSARAEFVASLGRLAAAVSQLKLIVKDVEPGYPRALLGDRAVRPIGRDELMQLLLPALPGFRCRETPLFREDSPNFALVFER
jgi:hypothetical protein